MFVFSNLATSIDGKIGTQERGFFLLGTKEDHKQMLRLRKKSDAVLIGASTLRSFKKPIKIPNRKHQPLNVLFSSQLQGISPEWEYFRDPQTQRVLFITTPLDPKRTKAFEKSSEIVVLQKNSRKSPVALQMMRNLEKRGIHRLLVEGGGGLMWEFVRGNWLDEIHLTLTPRIVGGSKAPTLVDGVGFRPSDVLGLQLKKVKRLGNELFLIYQRI
ncbi:MAG: dihydrofolate reductase family protein [Bdellovibrio sp.]|nr:dihydrofolate reductase family protein [Bdellovibrio sp.]